MASARNVRRCALQTLYQFDAGNADSPDTVRASLEESAGDDRAHQVNVRYLASNVIPE